MNLEEKERIKEKYLLNNDELLEMYNDAKELLFINKKVPNKKPIAILTGGQPGAGKSNIVIKSMLELKKNNREPVILDGDSYRGLYKNSEELARNYPELYSDITDVACGKIMGMLIIDTINGGYDFIREGTLNSAEIVDQLLASDKDYDITIRLLAVCREESLLSSFERYIEMKKIMGFGRLVTIQSHDKRYIQFPKTALEQSRKGVRIEVYERSFDMTNPLLIYKSDSNCNAYLDMHEAIEVGRKRSLNLCMNTANERLKIINEELKEECLNNPTLLNQLQELNDIINKSIELYNDIERE